MTTQKPLDINEMVRRALKYIIQGLAIAIAAYYIPMVKSKCKLTFQEITMIAIVGTVTFAILDMYTPSISM
jgi:hypothetical protein|tara:strand:- start:6404 stop:6616 length:213 start_codon:yes stop_codon:yes gene_type:complete